MPDDSFFASFPDFDHNPEASLSEEFARLGLHRNWRQGSKTWKKNWNRCINIERDRALPGDESFISFPGFKRNPNAPISEEFARLGEKRGWVRGSKTWRKNWKRCMNIAYDNLIGVNLEGLDGWQDLCGELGLGSDFPSIRQCKLVGVSLCLA